MKNNATLSSSHATAASRSCDPRLEAMARAIDEAGGFLNVLVGVDGTSSGRDAIALADRLRGERGSLTLAHVVRRGPPSDRTRRATAWSEAQVMLKRERDAVGVAGGRLCVFAPTAGRGLRQLAEERDAGLLVVGSSRHGSIGRLLRGDARSSLTGAGCAVAVAPFDYYPQRKTPIETIGVAYNGTPEADAALSVARGLAARHGAKLRALTVLWPTGFSAASAAGWALTLDAEERAARHLLLSLAAVEGDVSFGPPEQELAAFADEVDLLVVGSRGHGPVHQLVVGSTSAQLARPGRWPVLIVPRTAISEP